MKWTLIHWTPIYGTKRSTSSTRYCGSKLAYQQWRNSPPPPTSDGEISANLLGKERQGKKGKWARKEGKSKKGRWKIFNGRRKSYRMRRWLPPPFFFLLFTFQNHLNMFLVYQSGNFLPGKSIISHREKVRKNDFAPSPLKNIPLTPLRTNTAKLLSDFSSRTSGQNRV